MLRLVKIIPVQNNWCIHSNCSIRCCRLLLYLSITVVICHHAGCGYLCALISTFHIIRCSWRWQCSSRCCEWLRQRLRRRPLENRWHRRHSLRARLALRRLQWCSHYVWNFQNTPHTAGYLQNKTVTLVKCKCKHPVLTVYNSTLIHNEQIVESRHIYKVADFSSHWRND